MQYFVVYFRLLLMQKPRCKTCTHMLHAQESFGGPNDQIVEKTDFIMCSTPYFIYSLICTGHTTRPLRERFGEHRLGVEKCLSKYSISRPFLPDMTKMHNCSKFFRILAIPHNLPDGERFQKLCNQETFWIYKWDSLFTKDALRWVCRRRFIGHTGGLIRERSRVVQEP